MSDQADLHKDRCFKCEPQIVKELCTCSRWINYGTEESPLYGYTRTIYPDGSGHCRNHCYFGCAKDLRG